MVLPSRASVCQVGCLLPELEPFKTPLYELLRPHRKHSKWLLWNRFYQAALVHFSLFWLLFVSTSLSDCSEREMHESLSSPSLFFSLSCRSQPVPSICHPLTESSMMETLSVLFIKLRLNGVTVLFDSSSIRRCQFYKQHVLLLEQRLWVKG